MKTTRQVSESKTKVYLKEKTDFPPWSISDILLCIVLSYLVLYTLTSLFEALVLKDMSLEFYGSLETMDKVVILGLGTTALAFFSCFLFWSIILLRRYDLTLSDIGLNRSISKPWVIKSVVGGIIYGHLIYFVSVYWLIGSVPDSWQMIGPFYGKLLLHYALPVHLIIVLYGSVVEEIFFRGMCYTALKKVCGVKWGILLASIIFTLSHVQNIMEIPMISISIFISGLVFSFVYEQSKALLPAMIVHVIVNVTSLLLNYNIHPFSQELHQVMHQLFYF